MLLCPAAVRGNPGPLAEIVPKAGWGGHERPVKLEWAVVGLVIWLISLETCLVCATEPEAVDLGYAQHESARGTTERPQQ